MLATKAESLLSIVGKIFHSTACREAVRAASGYMSKTRVRETPSHEFFHTLVIYSSGSNNDSIFITLHSFLTSMLGMYLVLETGHQSQEP